MLKYFIIILFSIMFSFLFWRGYENKQSVELSKIVLSLNLKLKDASHYFFEDHSVNNFVLPELLTIYIQNNNLTAYHSYSDPDNFFGV